MMEKEKTITIRITDKEVDAVEDALFCRLDSIWWEENRVYIHSFWRKLAYAFDTDNP